MTDFLRILLFSLDELICIGISNANVGTRVGGFVRVNSRVSDRRPKSATEAYGES